MVNIFFQYFSVFIPYSLHEFATQSPTEHSGNYFWIDAPRIVLQNFFLAFAWPFSGILFALVI